jgi:Na+-translocating ferredoxin:NAD+ oxidoreductase RnfD subunit
MDISFYASVTHMMLLYHTYNKHSHSGCAMMCSAVLTPASPKLFSPLLVVETLLHLLSGGLMPKYASVVGDL